MGQYPSFRGAALVAITAIPAIAVVTALATFLTRRASGHCLIVAIADGTDTSSRATRATDDISIKSYD